MIRKGDTIENRRTGQRMKFLRTWEDTNGTQLQIECFSPPTAAREPEHIHPYQVNRFHVISGRLHFRINGKIQVLQNGESIDIPKNTPHCFWNEHSEEAHYVQEFFPALRIDGLFETFFALARDGKLNKQGAPNLFRTSLIMLRYQNEIRLSTPPWIFQKALFCLLSPIARMMRYKPDHR